MPPYVAFRRSSSHLAFSGWLGKQYDPFIANQASTLPVYDLLGNDTGKRSGADLFQFPAGVDVGRVRNRQDLVKRFDRLRRDIDQRGSLDAVDTYRAKAGGLAMHSTCPRKIRRRSSGMANTCGASRRYWPGDWSKPVRAS